jgi:hypothetical protein
LPTVATTFRSASAASVLRLLGVFALGLGQELGIDPHRMFARRRVGKQVQNGRCAVPDPLLRFPASSARPRLFGLALIVAVAGQYPFGFFLGDGFFFAFAADVAKEYQ